jgi:hypothetical protein
MDHEAYLKVYQTLKSLEEDEKAKKRPISRNARRGWIFGVFAASFALTLLVCTLLSRLASERGIDDRPARAAAIDVPSVDRPPKAGAIAQVPAKVPSLTLQATNVSAGIPMTVDPRAGSVFKPQQQRSEFDRAKQLERSDSQLRATLQQHPAGPNPAGAAEATQQRPSDTVDKQNSSSLQADLDKTQQNPEAQQPPATSPQEQQAHAEEDAWHSLDQTNGESVGHFLAQYPGSGHAAAAQELLRGLAQQEQARKLNLADDNAWGSVASADRHSLEQYLNDFPSGNHVGQARQWLSEISAAGPSRDANAVIATLEKYSHAWNAKNLAEITAIRPGLGRRTAKEELSSTRSIVMRIHPTSVPRIEGDHATVECIHQVDQVFNDGIEKQNPGVRMTYVLVKRGGNWLIAESR